jgi:fibronectin-binding autotransporter adhesin
MVNAGVINVQNSAALGGANYGNTIATGAALQLQGDVNVSESEFSVTGSGQAATGAIRNISGSNSLSAALDLGGNTTVGADAGTMTLSGDINLGSSRTLTTAGAGKLVLSGALSGGGSNLTVTSGVTTLAGSSGNAYSGTTTVTNGTLQLNKTAGTNATGGGPIVIGDGSGSASSATLILLASNQIPDYTTLLTINADGRFALNNFSETINTIAGTGLIDLSTSGYLNVGIGSSSSVFGGRITGSGTLEKSGSGSLTFNSSISFAGTLLLSGGTLSLNGTTLNVGTLHITGNTVIDFGSQSASMLNSANFIIDAGAILTITGWVNSTDYFYARNWSGATHGTTGSAPTNQVTFTGYSNSDTNWKAYDNQVTPFLPVPEPAT